MPSTGPGSVYILSSKLVNMHQTEKLRLRRMIGAPSWEVLTLKCFKFLVFPFLVI